MLKKYSYFIISIALFLSKHSAAQLHHLKNEMKMAGFISLTRYDASRPAVDEQVVKNKGRILQINIWYPVTGSVKGTKQKFADYVHLVGKEINEPAQGDVNWKQAGIKKYFEWPLSAGADQASFERFLHQDGQMSAIENAKVDKKEFPVVMLVHGYAADYAYMAEYLAGKGYLVIQVPVKGSTAYELDYEGKGLETQVLDYEYGLRVAEEYFGFKVKKAITVGFSFGGQSALALAVRNPAIKAVISLDGGIGSAFGASLVGRQSYFSIDKVNMPILHLYNPTDSYTDLKWLRSYKKSNRILIPLNEVEHGHFTSFGLLDKTLPGLMGKTAKKPGDAYETIMKLSGLFINQVLKQQEMTKASLETFIDQQMSWAKPSIKSIEVIKPE